MPPIQTNEGWEKRFEQIKWHAQYTEIGFDPGPMLADFVSKGLITQHEQERSSWKILLIEPFLRKMVLNMIKGTVKYPGDDWSTETWKDMGQDDRADSNNYDLLMEKHLKDLGVL